MIKFTLIKPNRIIWQEKPSESDIKKIEDINSKYFPVEGKLGDLEIELGRTEEEEKKEDIKKKIQELKKEREKLSEERQKLINEAAAKVEKINDLDKNSGLNETLLEIMTNSDLPDEVRAAALTNPNLSDYSLNGGLRISVIVHLLSNKSVSLPFLKRVIKIEKGYTLLVAISENPNADSDVLSTIAENISLDSVTGFSGRNMAEEKVDVLMELLDHPNADEKVYKTLFDRGRSLQRDVRAKILKKYPKFEQNEGGEN